MSLKIEENDIPGVLPKADTKKRIRISSANEHLPAAIKASYPRHFVPSYIAVWATFENPWNAGKIDLQDLIGKLFDKGYPKLKQLRPMTERGGVVYKNVSHRIL